VAIELNVVDRVANSDKGRGACTVLRSLGKATIAKKPDSMARIRCRVRGGLDPKRVRYCNLGSRV